MQIKKSKVYEYDADLQSSKCDEGQPSCNACERHGVPCRYEASWVHSSTQDPKTSSNQASLDESSSKKELIAEGPLLPIASRESAFESVNHGVAEQRRSLLETANKLPISENSRMLELRLLHQFTAFTSFSFSNAGQELWSRLAPQIALSFDFLLDTIFAVAALHLFKLDSKGAETLDISRRYFRKALVGQSEALVEKRDQPMAEALLLTGTLMIFYTLAWSAIGDENVSGESSDLFEWLRVGCGARIIFRACEPHLLGSKVTETVFRFEPDMLDRSVAFNPTNIDDFKHLLEFRADLENISDIDIDAYERALSYISLIFKKARDAEEDPLITCRRVISVPSMVPARFVELVEERRPRALAIMAHLFAAVNIIKADLWWRDGIAERQLGIIRDLLPNGWEDTIDMPLGLIS